MENVDFSIKLKKKKWVDGMYAFTWQFQNRDNKFAGRGEKVSFLTKHETGGLRTDPMKMLFCAHARNTQLVVN